MENITLGSSRSPTSEGVPQSTIGIVVATQKAMSNRIENLNQRHKTFYTHEWIEMMFLSKIVGMLRSIYDSSASDEKDITFPTRLSLELCNSMSPLYSLFIDALRVHSLIFCWVFLPCSHFVECNCILRL